MRVDDHLLRRRSRGVAALAAGATAVALVLSGCAGGASSKAGPGVVPHPVVIALADSGGRPPSDDAERFADLIEEYTDGALVPEIRWEAHETRTDRASDDGYRVVGDMLLDGEVDLAVLPDFVWIDHGAKRLSAVKTPFLVTSQAAMDAIATEDLATSMLDEFDRFGVVGLALLPETLRHPIGFGSPILEAADVRGATLRSLDPAGTTLIEQLGGTTSTLGNEDLAAAVEAGRVHGAESAFAQVGSLPNGGTFTADVTFFAKFNTAVANEGWFDALDADVQDAVRRAAHDTVRYVIDSNPSEDEAAAAYCEAAGSVTLAGADAIAGFEAAARPVRVEMERDADVRETIAAIEQLTATIPPEPAQPCELPGADAGESGGELDAETAAFPAGTYRADVRYSELLAAGVDTGTARDHMGVWTLTFEGGVFDAAQEGVDDDGCPGSTYRVADGRISVRLGRVGSGCGSAAGAELFNAEWTQEGDAIRFVDVRSGEGPAGQTLAGALWGGQPWHRIG